MAEVLVRAIFATTKKSAHKQHLNVWWQSLLKELQGLLPLMLSQEASLKGAMAQLASNKQHIQDNAASKKPCLTLFFSI